MRPLAILLLLAALAPPAAGQPRRRAPAEMRAGEVFGTLLTPDQPLTIPPDAVLTLRVLYEGANGTGAEVLAERTVLTAGQQFPLAFSLPYDASRVRSYSGYVLHADVHDAAGLLLWSNTLSPPIPPGIMFAPGMASTWAMDVYGAVPPAAPDPASAPGPVGTVRMPPPTAPPRAGARPRPPAATPTPAAPAAPERVYLDAFALNARWQLTETFSGAPAGLSPASYTLTFRPGLLLSAETACRSVHGTYEADDEGRLAIGPRTTSLARCAPTPEDDAFDRALAGLTGFSSTWRALTLTSATDTLRFTRTRLPDGAEPTATGRVYEYVCGTSGAARIRTSEGDAQLWLSDGLADRPLGTGRAGIYHVLPQVLAERGTRYADGPLTVETDGFEAVRIGVGGAPIACTVAPTVVSGETELAFNVYDGEANVEVYSAGAGRAYISIFGGTGVEMDADVTTPAPGRTVYRGPFGFVLTTITGGCDGAESTRAVVEQPERTYEVCIPALP